MTHKFRNTAAATSVSEEPETKRVPLPTSKKQKPTEKPATREEFLALSDEDRTSIMVAGLNRYATPQERIAWINKHEAAWRAGEPATEPGDAFVLPAAVTVDPANGEVVARTGDGVRVDLTQERYKFLQEVSTYMKTDAGIVAFMDLIETTVGALSTVVAAPYAIASLASAGAAGVILTVGDYVAQGTAAVTGWLLAAGIISCGGLANFMRECASRVWGAMKWVYEQLCSLFEYLKPSGKSKITPVIEGVAVTAA